MFFKCKHINNVGKAGLGTWLKRTAADEFDY